jgi:hypothetical protein
VDKIEDGATRGHPRGHVGTVPADEGDEPSDAGNVEQDEGRSDSSPPDRAQLVPALEAQEVDDPFLERRHGRPAPQMLDRPPGCQQGLDRELPTLPGMVAVDVVDGPMPGDERDALLMAGRALRGEDGKLE